MTSLKMQRQLENVCDSTSSIEMPGETLEPKKIVRQNVTPAKRGRRVESTSGSTPQIHVTDEKTAQVQPLTFKSKKNLSMTISNNEVSGLITYTCKISNEKSKIQKSR